MKTVLWLSKVKPRTSCLEAFKISSGYGDILVDWDPTSLLEWQKIAENYRQDDYAALVFEEPQSPILTERHALFALVDSVTTLEGRTTLVYQEQGWDDDLNELRWAFQKVLGVQFEFEKSVESSVPLVVRKKIVVIDGAWLFLSKQVLGIDRIPLKKLLRFLTSLGIAPLLQNPIFIIPPVAKGIMHDSDAYLFEFRIVSTHASGDDGVIIDILKDTSSDYIREIVLLTGDGGFVSILEQKYNEGIAIYVVMTEKSGKNNKPRTSKKFFNGRFNLVELAECEWVKAISVA